jgi:hypothetical protein
MPKKRAKQETMEAAKAICFVKILTSFLDNYDNEIESHDMGASSNTSIRNESHFYYG